MLHCQVLAQTGINWVCDVNANLDIRGAMQLHAGSHMCSSVVRSTDTCSPQCFNSLDGLLELRDDGGEVHGGSDIICRKWVQERLVRKPRGLFS